MLPPPLPVRRPRPGGGGAGRASGQAGGLTRTRKRRPRGRGRLAEAETVGGDSGSRGAAHLAQVGAAAARRGARNSGLLVVGTASCQGSSVSSTHREAGAAVLYEKHLNTVTNFLGALSFRPEVYSANFWVVKEKFAVG